MSLFDRLGRASPVRLTQIERFAYHGPDFQAHGYHHLMKKNARIPFGKAIADVDLERRELHVRQRADRFNDIGKPKSEAGERTVPMPPLVTNTLREWRLSCPRPRTSVKDVNGTPVMEEMRPEQLVFPNGQGKVDSLSNIMQRGFLPAQVAAGVSADTGELDNKGQPIMRAKYTGFHSLWHFYASWLINRKEDGGLGLPPKSVQKRLGDSTIALTMDTYSHLFPRTDDAEELASAEALLLA